MAVTRAGVGQRVDLIGATTTPGTRTVTFNVSPAAENAYGIVACGYVAAATVTGAALSVKWDGVAMTPLLASRLHFASNKSALMGWIIEVTDGGPTEAEVTFDDVPTGVLFTSAAVFANVEPLNLGAITSAVVSAVGTGAVTTSGVTVPSGVPADRVISVHQVGLLNAFSAFSGTRVAAPLSPGAGQMILGESRGATSVVPTATHGSTADWAAFGLNLDALPLTGLGFSGSVSVPPGSFGASLYRFAEPHPDRDYLVPPVGSADPKLIAGSDGVVTANGVTLPVWIKDPDDTLDYTMRWNHHLAPDDEIIKVEHTSTGSVRIISEAINPANRAMTQFWVKGATRGVTHPVRVRFWTRRGRQHDFTAFIAAENN